MRAFAILAAAALSSALLAQTLAPTGTLRVAFLANNPAQSTVDAKGERHGIAIDLAGELARKEGVAVSFNGLPNPAAVMDAVAAGRADIGFVAYAAARAGAVEFSQTYLLNGQTLLVPKNSPITSAANYDQPRLRIGGVKGDSISLYLERYLKKAVLVETDGSLDDTKRQFAAGDIDAFGANRQRLTAWLVQMPGYRVLPDDLMEVPQTIILVNGKTEALKTVNGFLNDTRQSGLLERIIRTSGVIGVRAAPAGYGYGKAE